MLCAPPCDHDCTDTDYEIPISSKIRMELGLKPLPEEKVSTPSKSGSGSKHRVSCLCVIENCTGINRADPV